PSPAPGSAPAWARAWCRRRYRRRGRSLPSCPAPSQSLPDRPAQRRQDVRLEPRIALDPDCTAPRRVRQREKARAMTAEVSHRVGQVAGAYVMRLRIAADQQEEPAVGHRRQHALVPQRRALAARRQVAALALAAIAEAPRHQRDLGWIVERYVAQARPGAQPVAAVVLPRHAALVDLRA